MAEASQYRFDYKELAEILVKHQGIHEGYWRVYLKFGLNAIHTSVNEESYYPSALVPVLEVGITNSQEMEPLSVNAAEVNPAPAAAKKGAVKKGKDKEKGSGGNQTRS